MTCIHRIFAALFFVCFFSVSPNILHAQSQSLSVTPPLFQLSVEPGDIWQSTINVINPNDFPLTVYTEVVNFAPEGEGGLGRFAPILTTDEIKATLAEWIEIAPGPHVIEAGKSKEVSFFVDVPIEAAPGGHFAAILISTEPPKQEAGPLALITTQTVASLFFTRIEGDVVEKADIREFSTLSRSIELPEAEFSLRFENKGNVHVQPRGDIVITNMWGKERGIIPVNHDTHFGNVLPESIRDFHFSWRGERSLTDIGRYKANATLAYGSDGVKNVTSTTYFWVIPIRGALLTVLFLFVFILVIVWAVRLYVRRMLILAGIDPDQKNAEHLTRRSEGDLSVRSYARMTAPIREGTLSLRTRLTDATEFIELVTALFAFAWQYKRFFIVLLVFIFGFIGLVFYAQKVSNTETEYEVTIHEGDQERTLTDDDIQRELKRPE